MAPRYKFHTMPILKNICLIHKKPCYMQSIDYEANFFNIFVVVVQVQLSPISPHYPPHPSPPPTLEATLFDFVHVSLTVTMVLDGPSSIFPHYPLSAPPHWLLSVCSLFQCLWLYFACLFVLFIRFHF